MPKSRPRRRQRRRRPCQRRPSQPRRHPARSRSASRCARPARPSAWPKRRSRKKTSRYAHGLTQAQARLFNSFFQQPALKASGKREEDTPKSDFERTFLPCEFKNIAKPNPFYRAADDTLLDKLDTRERSPAGTWVYLPETSWPTSSTSMAAGGPAASVCEASTRLSWCATS